MNAKIDVLYEVTFIFVFIHLFNVIMALLGRKNMFLVIAKDIFITKRTFDASNN
jgi:hypothetical protein